MASFTARTSFPQTTSIPRAYFLGHHRTALTQMRSRLSSTDLVIECRDYRIPLTSRNPLFSDHLGSKPRVIVYLSRDLGGPADASKLGMRTRRALQQRDALVREADHPSRVFFVDSSNHMDRKTVLRFLADFAGARRQGALAPAAALVVGMPNVGKSTLLNGLRKKGGLGHAKVARTGASPGVTRKIGTAVKIVEGADESGSVYVLDTPGVFIPYVTEPEDMLKFALCGNVKEGLISPVILADYLLYHMNLVDPNLYGEWSEPTNDVIPFLQRVANSTGRWKKGGEAEMDSAAVWIVKRWRDGRLGRFILDEMSPDAVRRRKERETGSMIPKDIKMNGRIPQRQMISNS